VKWTLYFTGYVKFTKTESNFSIPEFLNPCKKDFLHGHHVYAK